MHTIHNRGKLMLACDGRHECKPKLQAARPYHYHAHWPQAKPINRQVFACKKHYHIKPDLLGAASAILSHTALSLAISGNK